MSKIATPLLLSWGCPTPIARSKSQKAREHARGKNGYTTPAISEVVGDERPWQEPPLAPPLEHPPWLLRSSDPGVLLGNTDPGFLGAPTVAPQQPKRSTNSTPKEQIAS